MTEASTVAPFASGPVSALSLTSDGELLAAITDHNNVTFATPHIPESPECPDPLIAHPRQISAASLTALSFPHRSALYTADARGALSRYDVSHLSAPRQTFTIQGAHSGVELTTVASLSASSPVLTAGKDGVIRVWDPEAKQSVAKLTGHRYDVRSIAIASSRDDLSQMDVTVVASAGRDRTVRLWDVRHPGVASALHVFKGHVGWVHAVSIADGPAPAIVSCSGDRTVRVWDLRTMTERVVFKGHQYRIWAVCVAPQAALAISGSTDATVRVWPIGDGVTLPVGEDAAVLEGHRDSVLAVATSRDGSFIASGCEDGSLLVWSGRRFLRKTSGGHLPSSREGVLVELDECQKGSAGTKALPKELDLNVLPVERSHLLDAAVAEAHSPLHTAIVSPSMLGTTAATILPTTTSAILPKKTSAISLTNTTAISLRKPSAFSPRKASAFSPTKASAISPAKVPLRAPPTPVSTTTFSMSSSTAASSYILAPSTSTEVLKSRMVERPEHDPQYDKSAAELVGALKRIQQLEHDLQIANERASNREKEVITLKSDLAERNGEITRMHKQIDMSKKLAQAVEVRALLKKDVRKADICLDYREPVNRIGAVSDQLTKLAERLDAMIATG